MSGGGSCNMTAPWATWWQDDLPCQFSQERARHNCAYLTHVLDKQWIEKGSASPGRNNHPLLQRWGNRGAQSFLELNALAEDLRLIDRVPGIDKVIADLSNAQRCQSAWHVIRSAALFARAQETKVINFFHQESTKIPDFLIKTNNTMISVECKIVANSTIQNRFNRYGSGIIDEIIDQNIGPQRAYVFMIFKNPDILPDSSKVLDLVSVLEKNSQNGQCEVRTTDLNLFVLPSPPDHTVDRAYLALCPRSPKEDLRVEDRAKAAAKQLRARGQSDLPGVFVLEIGKQQDPHFMKGLITKRFLRNQYRGISRMILSRSGTYGAPPMRGTLQYLCSIGNPNALHPVEDNLMMAPSGFLGLLLDAFPKSANVPAYRVGRCIARFRGREMKAFLPDIRDISPELLI